MKINIIGSGGFLPTPLVGCNCKVCNEARNNSRLARTGPSVLIDDNLMIDTPQDIASQLDKIKVIPTFVLYSHWHPDHTEGCRIFEFLHYSYPKKIINILIPQCIIKYFKENVKSIFYYESLGFVKIIEFSEKITVEGKEIVEIPLNNGFACAYIISDKKKKVLVCMDHSKEMPFNNIKSKLDLAILNLGAFDDSDNSITTFEDNLTMIRKIKPKRSILLHIEEKWKKTFGEYKEIGANYSKLNINFAHDFMEFDV